MTQLNEKQLRDGIDFEFDNDKHCEQTKSDDFRGGFISFSKQLNRFFIFFNGQSIHTSQTFTACKNRFNKLAEKWHLQERIS